MTVPQGPSPSDADDVERHPCPRCRAEPGSPCRSRSGAVAGTYHTGRFSKVPRLAKLLRVPTPADRGPGQPWRPGTPVPLALAPDTQTADIRIGYARVSTADQNPDHQIDALLRAGVDHVHVDTASGAKASRPKLDLVMQLLRECGIGLHVIEQGIDTSTMEGRAMFGMLSVLAELQRELIVANTNDGLASARARGRVGGRRPKLTEDQAALAQRLYDEREKTVQQIADMFCVPRSTVYGHLDKTKTVPRQPKKTTATKP